MKTDTANTETSIIDFGPVNDTTQNIIKVVGVGGGGCNAVGNMFREGMDSVTFAVCNTDSKSLSVNPVPTKIMLGTKGHGAGANPDKGREEAETNIDDLRKLFSDNTQMVFVVAAMGGGTGTGAGPLVAKVARDMGMLTIGIVTLPFYFEKKRKIIKALKGLDEMRNNVDALLIINNEQITKVYADSHILVDDALRLADSVMGNAVRSISELITLTGKIQTDFSDVTTTMRNGGGAIMAIGRASGEHRVQNAIIDALNSPLLYGSDISKATRILFNIYTSKDYQLYVDEIEEIDSFMEALDPNIDVIWGMATDDTLDEDAKITILATGFDNSLPVVTKQASESEDFDKIIEKLYGKKERKTHDKPYGWLKLNDNTNNDEQDHTEDADSETSNSDKEEKVEFNDDDVNTNGSTDYNEDSDDENATETTIDDDTDSTDDSSVQEPSKSFLNKVLRNIAKKVMEGLEQTMRPDE